MESLALEAQNNNYIRKDEVAMVKEQHLRE